MASWAADLVLVAHAVFVGFVVTGFVAIWAGHWQGWRWIHNTTFRWLHLAAIGFVAVQSLIGMTCPLTVLEDALRGARGERSFVARWLGAILYHDLPEWVFTVVYVAFALLTALTMRLVPVHTRTPGS